MEVRSDRTPQPERERMSFTRFVRRHRRRRRPRRLRGRARRRAHGLRDAAAEPEPRHDGADGLQPLGRRPGQGAAGARDRRARRRDGAAGGPRVHPRQGPQRLARGRRARHADAERPAGLPPRDEAPARGRAAAAPAPGARRAPAARGAPRRPRRARRRHRGRRRPVLSRPRGRARDRHLPQRPDPHRRLAHRGGARRRGGGDGAGAAAARSRLRGRPPQDRHAAAAAPLEHRFLPDGGAPRRRAPAPLLLRHRPAAGSRPSRCPRT